VQGALTIQRWTPIADDPIELAHLITELQKQAGIASSGNLTRPEGILLIQAQTLDAIFNDLARRAKSSEYLSQFEAYLRLGLKAQAQCRATLETLAEIKNPPRVAFVHQANIANGPQQVNNAPAATEAASRAGETENPPNKLLEQQSGERLDPRTSEATSRVDSTVAALAEVHGPTHS
jgi:hypothetical protein